MRTFVIAIAVVIGLAFAAGVVALTDGINDRRTIVGFEAIIVALGVVLTVLVAAALVAAARGGRTK